jgi:hypothetical protein
LRTGLRTFTCPDRLRYLPPACCSTSAEPVLFAAAPERCYKADPASLKPRGGLRGRLLSASYAWPRPRPAPSGCRAGQSADLTSAPRRCWIFILAWSAQTAFSLLRGWMPSFGRAETRLECRSASPAR